MTPATPATLQTKPAPTRLSEPTLTVGDLARASGVAPSAVRFYEKHGLITSHRTRGNQRRFHHVEGCLVKIIRVAQRVGLSVAEIRDQMADLPQDRRDITIDDFLRLRRRLEHEAHKRIQALTDVLTDLAADQKLCEIQPKRPTDNP
ncbi:MAG TPA: MerR family DNA-binding transcriptional regulator [Amycolatopsis sp.]|nr:MerR family DNA-binding transcriptional regulator [Amycolatopsis sp.]